MPITRDEFKQVRKEPFFHYKLSGRGGTRTLAVGRVLPESWRFVSYKVLKLEDKVCVLEITKLD